MQDKELEIETLDDSKKGVGRGRKCRGRQTGKRRSGLGVRV